MTAVAVVRASNGLAVVAYEEEGSGGLVMQSDPRKEYGSNWLVFEVGNSGLWGQPTLPGSTLRQVPDNTPISRLTDVVKPIAERVRIEVARQYIGLVVIGYEPPDASGVSEPVIIYGSRNAVDIENDRPLTLSVVDSPLVCFSSRSNLHADFTGVHGKRVASSGPPSVELPTDVYAEVEKLQHLVLATYPQQFGSTARVRPYVVAHSAVFAK